MKESLLKVQTELIYTIMTGTMKLPDPMLAAILARIRRISALLDNGNPSDTMKLLDELETYFREDSPLSEAIRKMVLDARPSQMKSIIRGYLVNYVYDW